MFTSSEKTQKKYNLELAVNQAQAVLMNTCRCSKLCVNAVSGKSRSTLYTLAEISTIVEDLVDDTLFYEGYYHGAVVGPQSLSRSRKHQF